MHDKSFTVYGCDDNTDECCKNAKWIVEDEDKIEERRELATKTCKIMNKGDPNRWCPKLCESVE